MAYGEILISHAISQRKHEMRELAEQIKILRKSAGRLKSMKRRAISAMNDPEGEKRYQGVRDEAKLFSQCLHLQGVFIDLSGFPDHWKII